MPISYKHKIYTALGTPTNLSGDVVSATDSAGVPTKDYTVKGETVVWNQLLDKSKFTATTTINGVTFTNNDDGTITANGTATANADFRLANNKYKILANHKCLITGGINSNVMVRFSGDPTGLWEDKGGGVITNQTVDTTAYSFSARVNSGTTVSNITFKPKLFDLTQMFGAGNEPATVAEFRAMFPDDYYPYNAGELKSVVPTSVEASGVERFQLLDKSKFTATETINGVTFTNNGDGTITYNGTTTGANYVLQSGLRVVAGHKYFSYVGENTNNKISVLLYALPDPYNTFDVRFPKAEGGISTALKNSNQLYYQPKPLQNISYSNFILKPQFFDLTEMFGAGNEPTTPEEFWQRVPEKLYGYNPSAYKSVNIPSSKYFPDGMRSAGSVYDEINFLSQKAIQRIGAVDMGTLNWSYTSNSQFFYTSLPGAYPFSSQDVPNMICKVYETRSYVMVATASALDGGININGQDFSPPRLSIKDRNYSDAAAFKSAMSGVMLYYELATPVETAITPPLQTLQTFKGFTSFSAPNSLMQNGPLSVTYYAEGGANPESGWLTSYKRKLYMGRTIEWNQLLNKSKYPATTTIGGVTFTNNRDGTITVNGTARSSDHIYHGLHNNIEVPVGHKILISGGATGAGWSSYLLYDSSDQVYGIDSPGGGKIYTVQTNPVNPYLFVAKGYTVSNITFKPQLFDLTQMFGAGNEPTTPEEFWSYFDHKLYPYNAGETQPLFNISRKSQWGAAPAGYRRCSYLQGIGNDTTYFVIPQIDITNSPLVLLECMYQTYLNDTNVFGSILNDIRFEQGIGWSGRAFSYNYGNGYGATGSSVVNAQTENGVLPAKDLAGKRLLFEYKNDTFYLNGIEQTIAKNNIYANGSLGIAKDVYLFGTNRGETKRYFNGKIYRFFVENQINLIPALDKNGVPCMFDLISKSTFYNQGTGEFLYELA